MVKSLLLNEGHLGIPRGLNYKKDPQKAMQELANAYNFIINYDVDGYNNTDAFGLVDKNREIGEKLNVILYVLDASNTNQIQVDGVDYNRDDLVKNVLHKMQGFQAKDKNAYVVPRTLAHEVHDAEGNPIEPGNAINSGDYRLSMLQNTREIRKYGGVAIWHEIFKHLLPMVGLQHQVYRRREESKEAEEGSQSFVVYYWGQNYMPYRVVLKANKEGKIITHARHVPGNAGEVDPKKGYAFWRTDRMFNIEKPIPLAFIDETTGSYDSTLITDEQGNPLDVQQLRRLMLRNDFSIINEEVAKIRGLGNEERAELNRKQQSTLNADPEIKKNKYFEFMKPFKDALMARGRKRVALQYEPDENFFYPFFTMFTERNGRFFPAATTAEVKFKQIWPEKDFPELYTER